MTWNIKGVLAGALLVAAAPLLAQTQATETNWDGLVRVRSDKIELVYLAPDADFRPYTRVVLDPSEMAMEKNWLRDQRRDASSLGGQATERDVIRALDQGRKQFDTYFADAFTKAGFGTVSQVVTGALEGALFAGCVVAAMIVARQVLGGR